MNAPVGLTVFLQGGLPAQAIFSPAIPCADHFSILGSCIKAGETKRRHGAVFLFAILPQA
ncbi:MAG: hypothetical protein WBB34_02560 [Xanthobacteraceae bacterium]